MSKLNLKPIGKLVMGVGKVVGYGLLMGSMVGFPVVRVTRVTKNTYCGNARYLDAVNAILDSDMASCYKEEAMELVKRNETSDYYGAVVKIMESDSASCYKVDMLETLNS